MRAGLAAPRRAVSSTFPVSCGHLRRCLEARCVRHYGRVLESPYSRSSHLTGSSSYQRLSTALLLLNRTSSVADDDGVGVLRK